MYFVYILQSETSQRYYIGSTENIESRMMRHNDGKVTATRNKGPWTLVHSEEFVTRSEAVLRERKIKSYKGGNAFRELING